VLQALALLLGLAAGAPPAPVAWVSDDAGFLSEAARGGLDSRLEAYQRQSGHHVLVWISRSIGQEPIEDFAVRAFAAWKVGQKGLDDGVVLFLLSEDRKARIEVGYGLEASLPDATASRILREAIAPRLQAGDRDGAIQAGVEGIIAAIEGRAPSAVALTATPPPGRAPPPRAARLTTGQMVLFGLVAVAFLILLVTNPSLALFLVVNILSSGSRGSGGGGYSGGGGRSGGGGASGSW
jgi:uncharacterized protein